ncbi:hypothetical protein Gasu2_24290 [Galdieria sulphuraria]|nr:hypothetical protein Gasu2_24290 [Galdieria sulphuraria]
MDETDHRQEPERRKRKPAGDEFIEQKKRQRELFLQAHPEYRSKPHRCNPEAESFVDAFYNQPSQIVPRFLKMVSCLWKGDDKKDNKLEKEN